MTGSGVTESPEDIFSQWKFLNPSRFGTRYRDFEEKYMRVSGPWKQTVVYQNLEELQALAALDADVAEKGDDMPEKMWITKPIELDSRTRALYDRMAKEMVIELESGLRVTASIVLTKSLRLAQIASGIASQRDEAGQRHIELIGSEKLEALADLLTEYCIEAQKKVVIFCRFRPSLDRIGQLLEKMKIPYRFIRGGMSHENSDESEKWFWQGDEAKIIVAQIEAGGQSINLQCSDTAIYYEVDYSLDHYWQSQDRIHRIGQKSKKVQYIHLVAEDTVELEILEALKNKGDVAEAIIRGIGARTTAAA